MIGKTIDELSVGERAELSKTISESDVYLFAGITGDLNPAHVNERYARQTRFGRRMVHGMLLGGLVSSVLANQLPGPGTIYVEQRLEFLAPVFIGDTVTARVEVLSKSDDGKRVTLETVVLGEDDAVVVRGSAVVSPPRRAP